MKLKNILLIGFSSVFLAGALAGCSSSSPKETAAAKEAETAQTAKTTETGTSETEAKEAATDGIDMSSFQTANLEGNEVTQDIFKDYDVTMVNVWATWCPYCIKEMPDLETVYHSLPDNANLISLCTDAAEEEETAKELMQEAGATFQVLVNNEKLEQTVVQYLSGFPTTFLIDSDGHLVGEPMVGAPQENAAEVYLNYLEAAMDK